LLFFLRFLNGRLPQTRQAALGTLLAVATGSCTATQFGETPKGKIRANTLRRPVDHADQVLTFGPVGQFQSLEEANS
jgi:hypothetical protein